MKTFLLAIALTLGGCATYDFYPPAEFLRECINRCSDNGGVKSMDEAAKRCECWR